MTVAYIKKSDEIWITQRSHALVGSRLSGGVGWCGVVWCGVVWCGVGWGGLGWGGVALELGKGDAVINITWLCIVLCSIVCHRECETETKTETETKNESERTLY